LQTVSTLPPEQKQQEGQSTAEMYVHPNGKFLYGSNRGHNTIVVYTIHPQTGKLTYVENQDTGGSTPRSFGVVPTGDFLLALNQASSTIVVFRIDPETGALEPTGEEVPCPTPVAAAFLAR
jgi:6-phosphogluconolactonase